LVENGITSVPTTLDGIERMTNRISELPERREWEQLASDIAVLRKANEKGEIGVDHFEILPRVALAGSAQASSVTVLIREREPRLLWNDGWARYYGLSDPAQPNRLSLSDKQISKEEYRELAEEILGKRVAAVALESMDPKEIFSRWEMKQSW
jgi:hypothetical protein